jgi:hypothetical protein
MSFVKRLISGAAILLAIGAGAQAQAQAPIQAPVQAKGKGPAPTPAIDRGPSNVDLVNKALNPGPSNPDVPLPHPDLAKSPSSPSAAMTGPQIYGRQEEGGGVFGLKVPIPADRNGSSAPTRYSSGGSGSNAASETR